MKTDDMSDIIYLEGWNAYYNGDIVNPYNILANYKDWKTWETGYEEARQANG